MQASHPGNTPEASEGVAYSSEIRFGVVMYGGVSLAIYINGVANEIFEMARATPRDRENEPSAQPKGKLITRDVYRRLSLLANNADLIASYARAIEDESRRREILADGGPKEDAWSALNVSGIISTRFVVDVIAGTSAGGINGMFLGKALANGSRFDCLKELWIKEGDIALLLNDRGSDDGVTLPEKEKKRADKPASLLNSDRMYRKLRDALESMKPLPEFADPSEESDSPLVEELDLYLTATDIRGLRVDLRLSDKVVSERRYKRSFHFRYRDGRKAKVNDLANANDGFLAFAARCTSAFPFAFEPMRLSKVEALTGQETPDGWKQFFPDLPTKQACLDRDFGDGGYLDNKPFSYVVDTLSKRLADVPVERKLIYIEPSPERFPKTQPTKNDSIRPPDAVQNSLAALIGIPRYEAIRDDLQSVLRRNKRVERVERVVRLGQQNESLAIRLDEDGAIPRWAEMGMKEMANYYGSAYLPYQRLRVYSTTDILAEKVAARWGVDRESDKLYALRAIVRVWRESNFTEERTGQGQTVNAFLDQFDVNYRSRRLAFLLRKVDQLLRIFLNRINSISTSKDGNGSAEMRPTEEDVQFANALPKPYAGLSETLSLSDLKEALHVLRTLKWGLLKAKDALREATAADWMDTQRAGAELRRELDTVLLMILGESTHQKDVLQDAQGVPGIDLDSVAAFSQASFSKRTLQEAVALRAEQLYKHPNSERTKLHLELGAEIDSLRIRRASTDSSDESTKEKAYRLAWSLLGKPELKVNPAGEVTVTVGTVAVEALRNPELEFERILNSDCGIIFREFFAKYYLRFDTYDQMSFPLYYETDTGEPCTVDVIRVSPEDAVSLVDEVESGQCKLAGTVLANFGAFLERKWRVNDIMWGRLDGAERLVQAVLPMTDRNTECVKRELIEQLQRAILRESLTPEGHSALAAVALSALDEAAELGKTPDGIKAVLKGLLSKPGEEDRIKRIVECLLDEEGLIAHAKSGLQIDRALDPETSLRTAARAVTILGRVLEGIQNTPSEAKKIPRWIARAGLLFQGIAAVSIPGGLEGRLFQHWLKVLYAFELTTLALALLLGGVEARSFALAALGLTLGLHFLKWTAADLIQKKGGTGWFAVIGSIGVILLACVGMHSLMKLWP